MPCTFQLEIDQLSPQAQAVYHQTLRDFQDYGPPPDDHHCFGPKEHHIRYNFEDAERFQAYIKALDLRFEEPDSQRATRGTVRTAPEVDTVQGHYGIYRIIDQVHNARIAQACHPGLRGMEFIEIGISDELYFGDILAVKTLAFNPGYFPRPSGSSVLPYHRTAATLPGDHCGWSAREYLVFRRDIRRSQALLRVDERVGVIEGFSGLTRLPSSFHVGRVYLGDVFYPEHLEIRGLTPILTHLPTILRHWKSRCAVPESLRALADSADLQDTRFDHRMFQHRVNISRDNELTVNCSADWLVGSRVLVGFLDREIEAVLVKSCNGNLTFQLLERYTGPPWVPVMVQQLGFQGEPLGSRGRSRRSSEAEFEGYRGDRGDRGYRGRSRSPSEQRYPQPLVGVYDPESARGSPDFEERYGRDEGQRREPEGKWDRQDQWDGPPGQDPRDSRQGCRPSSPEHRYWSPGPRQSSQWDRNDLPRQWDHFNQPQESFSSQGAQFRQARESFGSQDAQFRRPESEQYQNDRQHPSEYRSQHHQLTEPQFSPQGAQFYPSQPEDRPNDSQYPSSQSGHLQDRSLYHNPLEGRCNDSPCSSDQRSLTLEQYRAQNYQNYQRERGQSYGNEDQYPPDQPGHPSSQNGNQNAQFYRSQPGDRSYESQYPSSQPGHHQEHFEQPNRSQNRPFDRNPTEDRHPYVSEPQYPSEYQSQPQDHPGNASRYSSDQSRKPNPQFSPTGAQYYRGQSNDASRYPSSPQYPTEYRDQPQDHPNPQFGHQNSQSYHSDYPVIQSEQPDHRQDPQDQLGRFQPQRGSQTDQGYRNYAQNRPANGSQYPSDHQDYRGQSQDHFEPQFNPQGAQSYRSQPDNRYSSDNEPWYPSDRPGHLQDRLETPILSQNGPPYRNQPGDRQAYANSYQHPSDQRTPSQDHFKPQFSPQSGQPDRNQSYGRPANALQYPLGQPGPSNPQYDPQYPRNQSEDRQTLPRSLSPRVSTLSPPGDPIIRHSQSRSSISQASSVSGDHFEQPNRRTSAPRASYPPSCSGRQGYTSPTGYPVRNPVSYHGIQPQGPQSSPNQVPSTSRAAGYSDGLSPTGQSYYQGYATSSDGSEEDDSSSESEPEALPQKSHQKQGYNALYSHFPSSSGQKTTDRYSPRVPDHQGGPPSPSTPGEPEQSAPISTSEPVEPAEPPKPARPETPPFDPHNSRSWRHDHKDDICEVVEPVSQGQEGPRASQQPSQPVREFPEPSGSSSRSSGDRRDSRAIHGPSQPVRKCPEPSEAGSRSSVDHRASQASHHSVQGSWPVKDQQDTKPSRSSPDRKASTASHNSANPKWLSEPENSAPEEDQHPETPAQAHPYLPALLKHQVLVIDALNPELHIASAAATLAKTDWSLKTRGLKQRGTQVVVCKPTEAPRITGLLLDALDEASGINMVRFTGEHLLKIDFDRCLARKLRGILREPGAWDQRIVLQAARYLTQDPLTPKLENLLRNNSHIPEMSMEEWVAWYMERWVPDVLLSTLEYLEVGTKYLRRVESVQVLGEVSEEHGGLTAKFPKAKIAVIGDVLGPVAVPRHPETVEILKEAFSGLRGSQLISLRAQAPYLRPPGLDYLKIRPGVFPNPSFPILLIHNTSTKGTKEERNLQERKALDELVKGLLGLENEFSIPPEDLQIICIEKNQVRDLRAISTPGIRIRSRQEASEEAQGVLTYPEVSPGLREDDSAPQDHPQTTPIAIICCSNYKKSAFELIRAQLPQLLSYGTQATIFIGNIDEMEEAEGWGALVTRCEEVGCSYSYQMVPEERSWKYQPTKRDHKGFMGPLPEYGSSRGSSSEFGGFESPKSRSSGSGSPRSVTRGSESLRSGSLKGLESPKSESRESEPSGPESENPEPFEPVSELSELELAVCEPKPEKPEAFEPKPKETEPFETKPKACEPKPEGTEPSGPEPEEPKSSDPEHKGANPKFEEPEPSEPEPSRPEPLEPEHKVCEPKSEESEPSGPKPEACEPEPEENEALEPEQKVSEPKLEESEPSGPESEPLEPEHKVSEPKSEKPEKFEPEFETCEPKPEEPEPSEPEQEACEQEPEEFEPPGPGPEACEPKLEEPEPLEPNPEACEVKPEKSESSEPELVTPEPSEPKPESPKLKAEEPEPSGPEPEACEPKSEVSELSEPNSEELEPSEPKAEKSKPTGPGPEACEPKPEEPELLDVKLDASEPSSSSLTLKHLKSGDSEPRPEDSESSEPKSEKPEPLEPEIKACEPKYGESELLEPESVTFKPSGAEPERSEPKPEKPVPSEPKPEKHGSSGPGPEACEPKPEGPEPKLKEPEPSDLHLTASDPNSPNPTLEHLDLAITATVSPTLSPAFPRKSCSQTPEKDFTTPDCLLENLTLEDLEPSDQEYEDCEEEFQNAQEAVNEDSDTATYESTCSEHQTTTGPEESECLEKLEEKQ